MALDHYTPRVGIMRNVRFGVDDRGYVRLTLTVDTGTGWASTLSLDINDACRVIKETGVSDVSRLNGYPMYYTIEGNIMWFRGPMLPSPNGEPWEHDREKAHEEWEHMLTLHRAREEEEDD